MFKIIVLFAVLACAAANPINGSIFDQTLGNCSHPELSKEDLHNFENLLESINDQLFGKWRIFEVARSLHRDEALRNELSSQLEDIHRNSSNPFAAIYETVKAINQKLLETEGLDQEFNDVTEEEMEKFNILVQNIFNKLFAEKLVLVAIRELYSDEDLRNQVIGALENIVTTDEPKEAVMDAFQLFSDKLNEAPNVEDYFNVTPEEGALFDAGIYEIMVELIENRKIYVVLEKFITDVQFRNDTIYYVQEIVSGSQPKEVFFEAMNELKAVLTEEDIQ